MQKHTLPILALVLVSACGTQPPEEAPPVGAVVHECPTTPIIDAPKPAPIATCSNTWGQCSGKIGKLEKSTGGTDICSTDPGGSQSRASDEICDGVDNDCNGLVDEAEGCAYSGITLTHEDGQYFSWTADAFVQSGHAVCVDKNGLTVSKDAVGRNGWFELALYRENAPYRCQVWGTANLGRAMRSAVLIANY